ncbi:MAG: head decoration protein [Sphingobacteriales bacterium]|nr:head decoration protein [Sphingobacteriales bacterium]
MSVIATDYNHYSNLVKASDSDRTELFHELITVNEAAQKSYVVGTVLGKVTATGKYKIAVETAVDGSKAPVAIVVADAFGTSAPVTIAATTDTKVLALARGKVVVSLGALALDSTYNDATKKQAAYDSLKSVGIIVEQTV